MIGLAIVAVWFAFVAWFLVRQWWLSELATPGAGVDPVEAVALVAAPEAMAITRFDPVVLRVAGAVSR